MPLISVVIVIIVIGVLLWAANEFIPMQPQVKKILNIVVIVVLVLWLLSLFLPMGSLNTIRVGR